MLTILGLRVADPIATNGKIHLAADLDPTLDRDVAVRIQQIQIEQDTAKSTKLADGSTHIDLNRAGMGLMEIVTEADMRYVLEVFSPRHERKVNLTCATQVT